MDSINIGISVLNTLLPQINHVIYDAERLGHDDCDFSIVVVEVSAKMRWLIEAFGIDMSNIDQDSRYLIVSVLDDVSCAIIQMYDGLSMPSRANGIPIFLIQTGSILTTTIKRAPARIVH